MEERRLRPENYVKGFVFSLALTLAAYFLVGSQKGSFNNLFSRHFIIFLVLLLAVVQLAVQLVYFLHLGSESKPRWNLTVFSFMLMVLLILVLGSLWIMYNLNYGHVQHLPSNQVNSDIIKDEGLSR